MLALCADLVERFIIRKNNEWAFIYIDEQTGAFSCYSSFGTYAYCWTHRGSQTLKQFLRGLDFSYFMEKTRPGYRRFDPDATIEGIKRFIIEQRRTSISREEARSAWNALPGVDANTADNVFHEFCSSHALMDVYGGDYYGIARECPDGDSRGFWKVIWPEFIAALSKAEGHIGQELAPDPERDSTK